MNPCIARQVFFYSFSMISYYFKLLLRRQWIVTNGILTTALLRYNRSLCKDSQAEEVFWYRKVFTKEILYFNKATFQNCSTYEADPTVVELVATLWKCFVRTGASDLCIVLLKFQPVLCYQLQLVHMPLITFGFFKRISFCLFFFLKKCYYLYEYLLKKTIYIYDIKLILNFCFFYHFVRFLVK